MSASLTGARKIAACLWFAEQAEEAARFNTSTLPDGVVTEP